MEFIDTLVMLREAYKTGRFQEESVVASLRPYAREELERLQHSFCPNCGEFNNHYPEPCSFCMAEYEVNEARRVAANRARETRCVECGVISKTFVCSSCWGK